jgi:hypothetical protein
VGVCIMFSAIIESHVVFDACRTYAGIAAQGLRLGGESPSFGPVRFPDVAGSDIENVSAGMSPLPSLFEGERTMARIWVSRRWCSFQSPQCHAAIGQTQRV